MARTFRSIGPANTGGPQRLRDGLNQCALRVATDGALNLRFGYPAAREAHSLMARGEVSTSAEGSASGLDRNPKGLLQLFGAVRWVAPPRSIELPDNLSGHLLAYLAYRGDWVSRDALAALLWPQRSDTEARHNLRANLHRVRSLLAAWPGAHAAAFDTERQRVRLLLPTDVAAFRSALGRAEWHRAVELRSAPLLAGFSLRGFDLLAEWARIEGVALDEAWRQAALQAAHQSVAAGHAAQAAELLLRTLQDAPGEEAMQVLLRIATEAGCRDEALAAWLRFRTWLRDELGVEPQAATIELVAALSTPPARAPLRPVTPTLGAVPHAVLQPPRLIGRERERMLLADRSRAVIALSGEPGVGKTRLLEDAVPEARWLACRESLQPLPFAPVIEWIEDQRDALPELGAYRHDLARLVPSLADGELLPPVASPATRARLLEAMAQLLDGDARPIVFDDLQWADAATCELIGLLARRARAPLRLAWRSSEHTPELQAVLDALSGGDGFERIELAALTPAALLQLLADLSGADEGPALFGGWLHKRTGGNPFFVLQSLRALFESGRLRSSGADWSSALDSVTQDYSELELPPRVADLVARRLRAVSDTARRVLTLASVAGDLRSIEHLARAAALSPWSAAEAVAELQAGGLLDGSRFAHDLVREAVYRATAAPLRAVLHGAVAEHYDGVLAPARIAEHCWAAGAVDRAVDATVRAAEADRHAGLHTDALALLARALPRARAGAQRARLLAALAHIRLGLNDVEGAEHAAVQALDEPALPADRAHAWLCLAALRQHQGRLGDARAALDEAARSAPDHPGLVIARSKIATLEGNVAAAVADLEAERDRLRRLPPGPQLIHALTSLGAAYDELDDAARGLPLHEEAYRLAGQLGARYAQVDVAVNLLWSLSALGRNDEGVHIAAQALALGHYDGSATLRNNLAWSLAELGRIDEARALYEAQADGSDPSLALLARGRLLELAGDAGDTPACRAIADRIMATLASTDFYVAQAGAVRAIARYGSDAQLQAALAYLRPQPLDRSAAERLAAALRRRGIDPAPWIVLPAH